MKHFIKEGDIFEAKGIVSLKQVNGEMKIVSSDGAEFTVYDNVNDQHIDIEFDNEGRMYYENDTKLDLTTV